MPANLKLRLASFALLVAACSPDASDKPVTNDAYQKRSIEASELHPDSFAAMQPFDIDPAMVLVHHPPAPALSPFTPRRTPFGEVSRVVETTHTRYTLGVDTIPLPERREAQGRVVPAGAPELTTARDLRSAEHNPERMYYFTSEDGLGFSNPLCFLDDSQGNFWMGSRGKGVSRFDGSGYARFTRDAGLSYEIITCVYEDSKGDVWIGTNGGGVNRYDGVNFTIFAVAEGLHDQITNIAETPEGVLWIGTFGGGIFRYEPDATGSAGHFVKYDTRHGLCSNEALSVTADDQGNIWFFTTCYTIHKIEPARDGQPERIIEFSQTYASYDGPLGKILFDKEGKMWGYGDVLFSFDGSAYTHYQLPEALGDSYLSSMDYDAVNDRIWLSMNGAGVGWFTPSEPDMLEYYTEADGLHTSDCSKVYATKTGTVYINTGNGIAMKSANAFETYSKARGLPRGSTNSISDDSEGNVWISVDQFGLVRFDGESFALHTPDMGFHPNIEDLITDRKDQLWFTTSGGGLHKFIPGKDNDHGTFHYYMEMAGLSTKWMTCVMEDSEGRIWAGSNGGGIHILNPSPDGSVGGTLTHLNVEHGLTSAQIYTILESKRGEFWIGTHNGGINRYMPDDQGKGRWLHYGVEEGIPDPSVVSLMEDQHGHIWIGTPNEGILLLLPTADGKNEEIISFPSKTAPFGEMGFAMIQDDDEALWFVNENALLKLSPERYAAMLEKINLGEVYDDDYFFSALTTEDGYNGSGVRNAIHKDRQGSLWIGSGKFLNRHWPVADTASASVPRIAITSLTMADEVIDWNAIKGQKTTNVTLRDGSKLHNFSFDGLLPHYGLPKELILAYDNNNLTFTFAANVPVRQQLLRYKYQLEGQDQHWSPLTDRTEVPYANLPYGKYTFKVKALSSDGVWSEEARYAFTITPPWWLSGWAYAIYVVLVLLLAWLLYTFLKNRTLRIEREKSQARELAQAKEIETAYTQLSEAHQHLKSAQSQLVHAEKMASLGELTAGIAHEIQNPLNFVNNFSEVSSELIDEALEELAAVQTRHALSPDDLSETSSTLDDIKKNLEKITHHGKRADAIVKGMLAHSRSGKGEKEPTDINALAEEYLKLSYHGLRAKDKSFNADFKTDFDPDLPKVNVVPQDIGRVLLNLINNAFQAAAADMGHGHAQTGHALAQTGHALSLAGPLITVSTKMHGGHIEISVKDNGPGIPDAIKDKIFQPFFTTKPTGQGTGLGLSLSYDIVKAHGGYIKVESAEGLGATFTLTIPTGDNKQNT